MYKFKNKSQEPVISFISSDNERNRFIDRISVINNRNDRYLYNRMDVDGETVKFNISRENLKRANLTLMTINQISPLEISRVSKAFWDNGLSYIPHIVSKISELDQSSGDVWISKNNYHYFVFETIMSSIVESILYDIVCGMKRRKYEIFVGPNESDISNANRVFSELHHKVNVLYQSFENFTTNEAIDVYQFSSKDEAIEFKLSI